MKRNKITPSKSNINSKEDGHQNKNDANGTPQSNIENGEATSQLMKLFEEHLKVSSLEEIHTSTANIELTNLQHRRN